jgi:hypothetical protein
MLCNKSGAETFPLKSEIRKNETRYYTTRKCLWSHALADIYGITKNYSGQREAMLTKNKTRPYDVVPLSSRDRESSTFCYRHCGR